jgi:hypothetical protein
MTKIFFLTSLLSILFLSCNNIPKEKLTIIDNFVLGQSSISLSKQMDSLSIQVKRFGTKMIFEQINDIFDEKNFISMYHTRAFNLSNYRSSENENLGLLYPVTLTGTQNVMGMIVILGHTSTPMFLGSAASRENTLDEKFFSQDINVKLINDIKSLYTSKYGQPTDTFSMASHRFYLIKGNQIFENGHPDREGLDIKWESEYYTINFFTGLPSYDSKYNFLQKSYEDIFYIGGPRFPMEFDPIKNEVQCNTYAYIKYELNDKAIKKLKLDNKAL